MPVFLIPFLSGAKSFLGALLAFFSKPPGSYIGTALAAIIALWWYGQHEFNKGAASVVQKQQFQAVRLVEHQANISMNISMKFELQRIKDEDATRNLLDQVPVVVSPAVDLAYSVPCGFVRLFDAATHDPIPDTACKPDDANSGIAFSEVARTDIENAGLYDRCVSQLGAVQDWIRQQAGASK